ncbi:MAG: hypothetical protein WCI72_06470 [archaeon]
MLRNYPVSRASPMPATGRIFYDFLMQNVKIPASAGHILWYGNAKDQVSKPDQFALRGDIPVGRTLELVSLTGKPVGAPYTFTGKESCVLVSDLSPASLRELGIPANARGKDKVFNNNFREYDALPELTKYSNELAALSVPKSLSSYLAGVQGNVNYSERDVLNNLINCFDNPGGPEMMHILHGNHLAWAALAYIREKGNVSGEVSAEFNGQNPADFYAKDFGTVLPMMFFALASLGKDPMEYYRTLDVEIYDADKVANSMRQYMPK